MSNLYNDQEFADEDYWMDAFIKEQRELFMKEMQDIHEEMEAAAANEMIIESQYEELQDEADEAELNYRRSKRSNRAKRKELKS